jgi:Methyltransferase domain
MSRTRAPLVVLFSLFVPVCFVLVSQQKCADTMSALHRGGGSLEEEGAAAGEGRAVVGRLAHEQSFGFFDDIRDDEWRERQERAWTHRHYENEQIHNVADSTPSWQWYALNYYPLFTCPNQHRVGGPGDGPKWVCDPLRLKKAARRSGVSGAGTAGSAAHHHHHQPVAAIAATTTTTTAAAAVADNKCLVYSVGSNGNFAFEDDLVNLVGAGTCETHVFDMSDNYARPGDVETKGIHFHHWGLKSSYDTTTALPEGFNYMTLQETMASLGHLNRTIDLFKIDCELCT